MKDITNHKTLGKVNCSRDFSLFSETLLEAVDVLLSLRALMYLFGVLLGCFADLL